MTRLFRRHPDRVEHVVVEHTGPCADQARIVMALDVVDAVLAEQAALYDDDRNEELVNALLEVRCVLRPYAPVPGRSS
jgi:hypothetical protein